MQLSLKLYLLAFLTLLAAVSVFSLGHIPQAVSYHNFCDSRSVFGISNFANVVSNLPFVVIGMTGFHLLQQAAVPPNTAVICFFLCLGIILTGLGSAYYHLSPDNGTLVFDRLPMTLVFMSLLAMIIGESVSPAIGAMVLIPLLAIGIGSVLWWRFTESTGEGDLRLYILVQYYPMILIPLILLLFPSPAGKQGLPLLLWAFAWYLIAKIGEHLDCRILSSLGFISGHSLKHLAAAASTWCLVKRIPHPGKIR